MGIHRKNSGGRVSGGSKSGGRIRPVFITLLGLLACLVTAPEIGAQDFCSTPVADILEAAGIDPHTP